MPAGLHQRLVVTAMESDLPGPVLTKLDARSAAWAHRVFGEVPAGLRSGRPLADDPRLATLEPDQQTQIVPFVGLVVIRRAIRIHSLDVNDVDLILPAID